MRPCYYFDTDPNGDSLGTAERSIRTDIRTDRGALASARNMAKHQRKPVHVWRLRDVYAPVSEGRKVGTVE